MNARERQDACRPMVSPCATSKESTICDGLEPWTEGVSSTLVHWKKADVCKSTCLHPMVRTRIWKSWCVLMLWLVDYCRVDVPDHDTPCSKQKLKFFRPFLSFQDAFSNPKSQAFEIFSFSFHRFHPALLLSGEVFLKRSPFPHTPQRSCWSQLFWTSSLGVWVSSCKSCKCHVTMCLHTCTKRSLVNLKTNRATLKVQLCHGARTVDREMCVLWQSNVHQACQLLKQHHE